jgi:type I restriction enzyme R subunit
MDTIMTIQRAVDSSPSLRNKKDLILQFVDSVSITGDTVEDWKLFVAAKRDAELDALIAEEALKPDETRSFVANALRDGAVPRSGTAITRVLPPVSRFAPGGDHGLKKQRVLDKLFEFFDRYMGLT